MINRTQAVVSLKSNGGIRSKYQKLPDIVVQSPRCYRINYWERRPMGW